MPQNYGRPEPTHKPEDVWFGLVVEMLDLLRAETPLYMTLVLV